MHYSLLPRTTLLPLLSLVSWSIVGCHSAKQLLPPESALPVRVALAPVVYSRQPATLLKAPLQSSFPASKFKSSPLARANNSPQLMRASAHALMGSASRSMGRAHKPAPVTTDVLRRSHPAGLPVYGLLISVILLLAIALFTVLGLVLFPISALWGILCYVVAAVGVIGLVKEIMHIL